MLWAGPSWGGGGGRLPEEYIIISGHQQACPSPLHMGLTSRLEAHPTETPQGSVSCRSGPAASRLVRSAEGFLLAEQSPAVPASDSCKTPTKRQAHQALRMASAGTQLPPRVFSGIPLCSRVITLPGVLMLGDSSRSARPIPVSSWHPNKGLA